ncbi:unnamed protein product [Ixodes pacificus]
MSEHESKLPVQETGNGILSNELLSELDKHGFPFVTLPFAVKLQEKVKVHKIKKTNLFDSKTFLITKHCQYRRRTNMCWHKQAKSTGVQNLKKLPKVL